MIFTETKELSRRPLQALLAAGGIILAATGLTGCNDRAFVDPLPPARELTLPAEGGSLSISTGLRGVESMSITCSDSSGDNIPAIIYRITLEGDTISTLADAAAAAPGTIAIAWPTLSLRVTARSDGRVEVISGRSLSRSDRHFNVNIGSSYVASYSMPLTVSGIEPLRGTEISYPYSLMLRDPDSEYHQEWTRRYTNLTDDTTSVIIHPYAGTQVKVVFTPDNPYLPIDAGSPLPLPSPGPEADGYSPGFYGVESPYLPGRELYYPVEDDEIGSLAVRVKIPPRVSRRYHLFLKRRCAVAHYRVTLISPSLAEPVTATGEVEVTAPVGYLIGYNDDPLTP